MLNQHPPAIPGRFTVHDCGELHRPRCVLPRRWCRGKHTRVSGLVHEQGTRAHCVCEEQTRLPHSPLYRTSTWPGPEALPCRLWPRFRAGQASFGTDSGHSNKRRASRGGCKHACERPRSCFRGLRLNCRPSGLATFAEHTRRPPSVWSSRSKSLPCRTWFSVVAIARSTVPVHSLVDDDEFGAAVAAAIWHGWVTGALSGFLSRPQSVRNPAMATELDGEYDRQGKRTDDSEETRGCGAREGYPSFF